MSLASIWLAMLCMGIITVALRAGLLLAPDRIQMPPLLRRALRFVPAAVLTAIYAPELLVQSGELDFSFQNARLLAGLVAIWIAWRIRRTYVTILFGMLALHLFGSILPRIS